MPVEGGPITVTEGNCVMIGDGTPGYVQITFTDITLFTQNGGNFDQAYVRATDGGYINVGSTGIVMNTSDNCGPCTGMTSQLSDPDYISDGYVQVCVTNGGAGVSSVTFTWETVDASGNNLCGNCSDGILNNQETGIDCGGPNCSPCPSCNDGILNNGETSIDCGGTDYDGRFKYSEVISVHNGAEGLELVKTINMIGQEVTPTYTGMVIDVYSDGSTIKRYKK